MIARPQVIEWGAERVRAGPWHGGDRVAYLAPVPGAATPSAVFLTRCLRSLAANGFNSVLTAALSPSEQRPFRAVGFGERERLHLLVHDLEAVPRPRLPARRGRRTDRPAVLAVDTAAFPAFWRLDGRGLDDALRATPARRFRVAPVRGPVVAYAISGRAGRHGYLQRLAVDPDSQGQGLGTALALDGLRWMRRWGVRRAAVNTQLDNEAALELYLGLGFRLQPVGLAVLSRDLTTTT